MKQELSNINHGAACVCAIFRIIDKLQTREKGKSLQKQVVA
jgi:hypothetical protein